MQEKEEEEENTTRNSNDRINNEYKSLRQT